MQKRRKSVIDHVHNGLNGGMDSKIIFERDKNYVIFLEKGNDSEFL